MVEAGLFGQVAIGLDLAAAAMWRRYGGQPGLSFLAETVVPRLRAEGFPAGVIGQLAGGNVARFLARRTPENQG